LTMALHSEQVRGFFSVPTDHLQATPVITDYLLKSDLSNSVAVFDLGQDKRAGKFSEKLGIPIAVFDKRRISDTEVQIRTMIGDVEGKDVIFFDDEISRGTSMVAIIDEIKKRGAREIRAASTHGLFSGPAIEFIQKSVVKEIITTNTVNIPKEKLIDKITVLSVAPIFAEAIKRIHEGKSISSMFE